MMARQARDTSMIMDCGKPMIIRTRACASSRHAQHIPIAGRSKLHRTQQRSGASLKGSPGITLQGGGIFTPGFPTTLTNSIAARNTPDQCFAADPGQPIAQEEHASGRGR